MICPECKMDIDYVSIFISLIDYVAINMPIEDDAWDNFELVGPDYYSTSDSGKGV